MEINWDSCFPYVNTKNNQTSLGIQKRDLEITQALSIQSTAWLHIVAKSEASYSQTNKIKVSSVSYVYCDRNSQWACGIWNAIGSTIWRDLFSSNRAQGIRSVWVLLTELCGPRFSSMIESRLKEDETEWDMEVNEHSPCLQVIFLPTTWIIQHFYTLHACRHTDKHTLHAQKHT